MVNSTNFKYVDKRAFGECNSIFKLGVSQMISRKELIKLRKNGMKLPIKFRDCFDKIITVTYI